MKRLILGLMLSMAVPSVASAELIDRVVAVVGKEVILHSDLHELLPQAEAEILRGLTGEARARAAEALPDQVLETLIAQELMDQAMDRADLRVDDREIDSAIADVATQNQITSERLLEELAKQGMDESTYRSELGKQLRQYKFMNMEIRGRVTVSEEDLRSRYAQVGGGANSAQGWRLQRILLKLAGDETDAAVLAEADTLMAQLTSGAAFADVAKARSDDSTTKDSGGDAGVFEPGQLSDAFREALEAVEQGQPARVDTPGGIFLLRVAEEVDTSEAAFDQVRDELYRVLYDEGMARELERWTEEERRRAHVQLLLHSPAPGEEPGEEPAAAEAPEVTE